MELGVRGHLDLLFATCGSERERERALMKWFREMKRECQAAAAAALAFTGVAGNSRRREVRNCAMLLIYIFIRINCSFKNKK